MAYGAVEDFSRCRLARAIFENKRWDLVLEATKSDSGDCRLGGNTGGEMKVQLHLPAFSVCSIIERPVQVKPYGRWSRIEDVEPNFRYFIAIRSAATKPEQAVWLAVGSEFIRYQPTWDMVTTSIPEDSIIIFQDDIARYDLDCGGPGQRSRALEAMRWYSRLVFPYGDRWSKKPLPSES